MKTIQAILKTIQAFYPVLEELNALWYKVQKEKWVREKAFVMSHKGEGLIVRYSSNAQVAAELYDKAHQVVWNPSSDDDTSAEP